MVINDKRYSALIMGAIIIALVCSAHIFAVVDLLNGFAYDYLMRNYTSTSASEQLIVIDGDKQFAEHGDEVWLPLLKNVLAQDVKQVVFSFLPERVSADFYQFAADSGKVIFGQQVLSSDPDSTTKLQPLPAAALGKNITLGLVKTAQSQYGIYRTQHRNISVDEHILPTLEYSAAQRTLGKATTLTTSDYRINFIGGTARIPKVKLEQAVSGGLVSELVAGRTVLIGVYGLEPLTSYFTPLSTATEQTSDVLYHAFALDTLVGGRAIWVLPGWALLLVIMGITVAMLIFCQHLALQRSLLVSVVLTLFYVLTCWLTLHSLFLWIPLVELVLAQWLTFALVWRYRIVQENQVLDTALFNLSINLQEKAFPVSFYHSQDPWTQLIVMINQSLSLNRMIFLERIPDDHRLKEIKAFKCSINDVIELRRDYERTPYSTVIQEHKPLLQEKPYLKSLEVEEQHYLVPLVFAGEVLGFWAFTVEPSLVPSPLKFLALVQAYMTQISEILYYRQEWQKRMAQEKNKFWTYLSFSTDARSYQMLNKSVALLDKRIAELQQVFNSLNTGGVLYDLFGRVLLLNKYIEELAQSVDLKLYNMTALDFITNVTGYDEANARNIMQKIIFDREMISIPISRFKADRDYILHIQPLKLQDHKQQINDLAPVFEIIGILCELEDITELKAIYRLKEQMFERFSFQMRNDLSTIVFALSILEDVKTSTEEKTLALGSIHGKIEETWTTLKSVNEQMNIEIESLASGLGRYPISAQDAIKKAVAALNEYAALRSINLHLKMPGLLSLVFASPNELYSVFHTVLTAMIDDTFEGAEVWIEIEETHEWVYYYFRNNGIGIANNKLQQLNEDTVFMSAENLKMDEVIQYIKHWEGQIEFSSQVGKSSTVTISLKRFL
ncbi:MAG: CHASE2 domain-containing protein [Methylococcaceae bacterium]